MKDITYASMPESPNGTYNAYSIDVIVSITTSINGATGQTEVIESHKITTWFTLVPGSSDADLSYSPMPQEVWYSDVYTVPQEGIFGNQGMSVL